MVARPAGAAKLVDMAAAVEIIEERARRRIVEVGAVFGFRGTVIVERRFGRVNFG